MQQTVVGVFDQYAAAQQAVSALRNNGFQLAYVTDVKSDATRSSNAAGSAAPDDGVWSHVKTFFSGLLGEDDHVAPYAEAVRRGGAAVKVDVDNEGQAERARNALEAAGAVNIDERAKEWRAAGWNGGNSGTASKSSTASASPSAGNTMSQSEGVIPVVKEELEVGKRTVRTGGVKVFARTVSTPVKESIDLRSEHAHVERRPVDRPATAADLNGLQDRTIEVRETAEKAVVSKTARVVEEVSVGKTVDTHREQINDSVRHTEVDVQSLSAANADFDRHDAAFRSDFQTRYGASAVEYSAYQPAYRYGYGLRNDARYKGRDWNAIENDVRRDWESAHPNSAWDKFKDAISHAWHSVTR